MARVPLIEYPEETKAFMAAIGDHMQKMIVSNMTVNQAVPLAGSAVIEGTLFALCSVAFDVRPEGVTGEEVAAMMGETAARYLALFQAEEVIGRPVGTA